MTCPAKDAKATRSGSSKFEEPGSSHSADSDELNEIFRKCFFLFLFVFFKLFLLVFIVAFLCFCWF